MAKPKLRRIAAAPDNDAPATDNNLFFTSPKSHIAFVNSGCETLNCVLGGGWPLGRMVNVVGDKSTGKTLLAIEAMANFQRDYPGARTLYDETEAAFDDAYAEALGLPMENVEHGSSATVEELFNSMEAFIKSLDGAPGLYIVDSLDGLSDEAEMKRGIGEGTYGATKPKQLGQLFRRLIKPLEKSRVLLLIVSQVRDAIGVTFGNKHTRSGGKALDFYASIILWLANKGQNKRTVNKIERTVSVSIKAKTSKNKVGLAFRECEFDLVFGYGVDDIGSGLDFLKAAGECSRIDLSGTDQSIAAFKKAFNASDNDDRAEMRASLNKAVVEVWYEIEATFAPKRGKYT